MDQKEIKKLLKTLHAEGETFKEQIAVYARELGDLASAAVYMRIYPSSKAGYIGEAKKAMGDLLMQMQITCAHLDIPFDINDLIEIGDNEFRRRVQGIVEVRKKCE